MLNITIMVNITTMTNLVVDVFDNPQPEDLLRPPIDYSFYQLKSNPFSGTVPSHNVDFLIERGDEIRNLSWTISSSYYNSSTHSIIVGGYGNGKTHLLNYFYTNLKKSNINKPKKILIAYINTPGKSFHSLYSSFIMNIGKEFLINAVWCYLSIICLKNPEILDKISDGKKDDILTKIESDPLYIKKIVEENKVILPLLIHRVKNAISSQVPLVDFITVFLHLILDDYSFLSWKWLCGESIPFTQRRELDLSMNIENDERALLAFLSLKKILHELGYKLIVLLIDEFEVIEVLAPREKQKILNEMRHLIDLTPEGLSIVLSCAPEIWRTILSDYHAFSERFSYVTFLGPLNENNIKDILVGYLKRNLSVPNVNGLYPFDVDILPFLLETGMGNVRQTLKLCELCIDYGIREKVILLNADTAKRIISQFSLFSRSSINLE